MESAHTPSEPAVTHARLSDVPADLLANRLVSSLIMLKGNLNLYDQAIQRFIERIRAEAAEDRAELLKALRLIAMDGTEDDSRSAEYWQSQAHQRRLLARNALAKAQGPQNPGESSREAMQDDAGHRAQFSDGGRG